MNVQRLSMSVLAMAQMLSVSTLMGPMSAPVNKATETITLSVKVRPLVKNWWKITNLGGAPRYHLNKTISHSKFIIGQKLFRGFHCGK